MHTWRLTTGLSPILTGLLVIEVGFNLSGIARCQSLEARGEVFEALRARRAQFDGTQFEVDVRYFELNYSPDLQHSQPTAPSRAKGEAVQRANEGAFRFIWMKSDKCKLAQVIESPDAPSHQVYWFDGESWYQFDSSNLSGSIGQSAPPLVWAMPEFIFGELGGVDLLSDDAGAGLVDLRVSKNEGAALLGRYEAIRKSERAVTFAFDRSSRIIKAAQVLDGLLVDFTYRIRDAEVVLSESAGSLEYEATIYNHVVRDNRVLTSSALCADVTIRPLGNPDDPVAFDILELAFPAGTALFDDSSRARGVAGGSLDDAFWSWATLWKAILSSDHGQLDAIPMLIGNRKLPDDFVVQERILERGQNLCGPIALCLLSSWSGSATALPGLEDMAREFSSGEAGTSAAEMLRFAESCNIPLTLTRVPLDASPKKPFIAVIESAERGVPGHYIYVVPPGSLGNTNYTLLDFPRPARSVHALSDIQGWRGLGLFGEKIDAGNIVNTAIDRIGYIPVLLFLVAIVLFCVQRGQRKTLSSPMVGILLFILLGCRDDASIYSAVVIAQPATLDFGECTQDARLYADITIRCASRRLVDVAGVRGWCQVGVEAVQGETPPNENDLLVRVWLQTSSWGSRARDVSITVTDEFGREHSAVVPIRYKAKPSLGVAPSRLLLAETCADNEEVRTVVATLRTGPSQEATTVIGSLVGQNGKRSEIECSETRIKSVLAGDVATQYVYRIARERLLGAQRIDFVVEVAQSESQTVSVAVVNKNRAGIAMDASTAIPANSKTSSHSEDRQGSAR